MKIIHKGALPQEKVYKTTCSSCHTTFEFKQGEGKTSYNQRDGDYIAVTCPLPGCGKIVTSNL